jgi:peptidoglycan/xylan/chitin deacetylase (PgdA/CDA1 family)
MGEIMPALSYLSQNANEKLQAKLVKYLNRHTISIPERPVVSFCFDDFPQSAFDNALPILEAHDWIATWYICGSYMDTVHPNYGPMFTQDALNALREKGQDIGCHTFDHSHFPEQPAEVSISDCVANRKFFIDQGLPEARSFAYPRGSSTLFTKRTLLPHFSGLRGVAGGINQGETDISLLKANGIQSDRGGIAECLDYLKELENTGGWMIIFTHDVQDEPTEWGCSTSDFQTLVDAVHATGFDVQSVGDVLENIGAHEVFDGKRVAVE